MNAFQGKADPTSEPVELPSQVTGRPEAGDDIEFDLMSLFTLVWRRKGTVAIFGLGFALLAMAFVYSLTPRYQAHAVVMLDQREEQFIDVESVLTGMTTDFFAILAEAQVLRSRKLAGRVVDKLDLVAHPYFNPDLVEVQEPNFIVGAIGGGIELVKQSVRGAVTDREVVSDDMLSPEYFARQRAIELLLEAQNVQSIDNTYVYEVTIETEDPFLSTRIANAFADLYITEQLETKFEATQAATEWLADRVAELRVELEESEAAVEAYNASTTLISEEALALGGRQLKELRERRDELVADGADAQQRAEGLDAAIAAGDSAAAAQVAGDPRLAPLVERRAALLADGADTTQVDARIETFKARALASLNAEVTRAERQISGVETSIAQLEVELAVQSEDLVELRQLMREAEANRRIYEQFLRRLNETSVQQGVQQPDARLLSPAVETFVPSYPNKTLTVVAAGFFGGLIGIAFVIFVERTNNSFRTAEDLEATTGISVMGSIPAAPVRRRADLLAYARERGSSQMMEAVRNLRTGVLLSNVDKQPQVVMLTSSLPKEGKTTCSILLAQNAAALGKKTLLIECDLRRRTFRSYFNFDSQAGLLSILTGAEKLEDVVHHDEETNLDVIPGEESKVNAADVLSSQRFEDFMSDLRDRYEFIIVDTPPVLAVPDARVIAPLADAVIYCARWNVTHRDLVKKGLGSLRQIKARVTGLALTQINLRKQSQYGYGGYDRYYYKSANRYYVN
ncbi:MAG: polysaccharide biosynthesis tyrosine autokinase [Pseudomonadota bacterium]